MKNYLILFFQIILTLESCDKTAKETVELPPLAPQELKATVVSDVQIDLNWTDKSTNESGFKIQRKTQSGNFTEIGSVGVDVTTFNDKGLSPLTTYIYRVLSYNRGGNSITYSNEITATTKKTIFVPSLNLNQELYFRATIAFGHFKLISDGGDLVNDYGICWSINPNPTISNNKIRTSMINEMSNFQINGLTPGTKYYFRAYATNSVGTGYSNEISITTKTYFKDGNGVKDIMGNFYKTVIIGNQEWMAENLKTIVYSDGSKITNATISEFGRNQLGGQWAYYQDNSSFDFTFGKLYNWYAASNKSNICPIGWHVPTRNEFEILHSYLDGSDAGGRMKEIGFNYWNSPNTDATNEGGFSARGAGIRMGVDSKLKQETCFWTKDPTALPDLAWIINLYADKNLLFITTMNKNSGISIRCLKD